MNSKTLRNSSYIDISEEEININKELLSILLKDRTTGKNIIWATNDYLEHGSLFEDSQQITIDLITGNFLNIIQPRVTKKQEHKISRTREKAEVFTPSWICNEQNNLVDEAWFGRKNIFNTAKDKCWELNENIIVFPQETEKTWQDYIKSNRLEITCGEAPYLVSRYDTVTGEAIAVQNRIGLLDRKLRVVNENTNTQEEWFKWAEIAFQSTYGYEYQGDNLLLARENLLYSFIDNMEYKFDRKPTLPELKRIATITSWNIWQMDGLKCVVPNSCVEEDDFQISLFEPMKEKELCKGCKNNDIYSHTGTYCKIKDWQKNQTLKFVSLINKSRES